MRNFIIISDGDEDKYVDDIWKLNTNYYLVTVNNFSKELLDFIKHNNTLLVETNNYFQNLTINKTYELFKTYEITPIFINKDNKSFTHIMYLALEELLPAAIEYTINDNNEDYELFLDLIRADLWEGVNGSDNIISTPRRRKTKTTRK